jgi:hypothetical protein
MKKSVLNIVKEKSLLKESRKAIHEKELGLKIPKDYFSNSEKDILKKISNSEVKVLSRKKYFLYSLAASIALLIALTIFKPNVISTFNNSATIVADTINTIKSNVLVNGNEIFDVEDVSIAALFVEDDKIDAFADNYVLEDVLMDISKSN